MPKKDKIYTKRIRAKVTPKQEEKVIKIGRGNISSGVREAIDSYNNPITVNFKKVKRNG